MADPATTAASHPDDAAPTPAAGDRSRRALRRRKREERPQGAWGKIRETLLVILYAVLIALSLIHI